MLSKVDLLVAFVRRRVLGSGNEARTKEQQERDIVTRGERAEQLLRSDAFVLAYQDELDQIIDELLVIDTTSEEQRLKALRLLARAQELRAIVGKLNGYVNALTQLRDKWRRKALAS